jgi:hypothetical protein
MGVCAGAAGRGCNVSQPLLRAAMFTPRPVNVISVLPERQMTLPSHNSSDAANAAAPATIMMIARVRQRSGEWEALKPPASPEYRRHTVIHILES